MGRRERAGTNLDEQCDVSLLRRGHAAAHYSLCCSGTERQCAHVLDMDTVHVCARLAQFAEGQEVHAEFR